jgi:outer membrane biosynthesis protein TonB
VRYGLIGSIILHIVIFGLVIFNFATSDDKESQPPSLVPVAVMTPSEVSERQAGKTDGKAEQPAPPAQIKAPEEQASAKREVEEKPSPKPADRELLAPAPAKTADAPVPMPKPVEQAKAEPVPEKPAEKPHPKRAVKKDPVPKPKPKVEEAKKSEDPEVARADQQPARTFDPNRIASLLEKDGAQADPRQQTSQSTMTTPTKLSSDRQTAVLNRDPNAGTIGGNYDPSRPWRPASSLQDQAMGLQQAHGAQNAGSCADLVQARIEQNWDLPIGALSAETTIVRLHIELKRDGSLQRDPTVMDPSFSPNYQAMADAAVRAAIKGQPYIIPPDQYERCRDMVLKFNPRDMYGG